MDPMKIEISDEMVKREVERVWGPEPQGFRDFIARQELVDMEKYVGHKMGIVHHYRLDDGLVLTPVMSRGLYESQKLKMRKDDVLLVSFPKSGTTWLQEIGYLIMSDLDFETAKAKPLDDRCPCIEWPECTFKVLQEAPSPRIMKVHLPYSHLPGGDLKKQYKIVYLVRNPKDVAVSMYHMFKITPPMKFAGDLTDVLNMFLADVVPFAPFHKAALEYWNHVKDGNVLFLKYEDLHKDITEEVGKIAKFLGKNFSDDQIKAIVNASSFKAMAAQQSKNHDQWVEKHITDPSAGNFMRKGKVGDWKDHMDEAMNKRFDEYTKRHFGHTDLKFDYE